MPVSAWSAPVTVSTPAAPVTLAPDDSTQVQRADAVTIRSRSTWSAPVVATTSAGATVLAPASSTQTQISDGATATELATGFGEGGFGLGGFGGVTVAGRVITLTTYAPPAPPPPTPIVVADPTATEPVAAVWAWSVGSWRTGPAAPLSRATNRRVTWRLTGRSEASFDLDAGTDEAAAALDELITDLWVTRSPVPERATCLFRGRIGSSRHSIDAARHTVSVSAGDYRAVLDRRQLWEGGQLSWVNADQGAIAWELVQHTQAQPGGGLGIVARTGAVTGISRARNDYPPGKRVGEALDQLAQVIDGFDYDITPAADPRNLALYLDVFYPVRGADRGRVLTLGDRVAALERGVDPGEYANAVRGTGAETSSSGTALSAVRREATDIATRPEGRWDTSMSDPDLVVQQTIVERTARELAQRQKVTPDWAVTLKPNDWAGPEDIWLGDPVLLVVKSGPLDVVASYRAVEISCAWDDNDDMTTVVALAAVSRPGHRWSLRRVDQRLQNLERR